MNGNRSRPAGNRAAGESISGGISSTPSLVPAGSPLDELAVHVDGTFVVVVEATGGRYRRRCFLTAAAAERSATNALANGHNAKVYLAELRPLWRLIGGADDA